MMVASSDGSSLGVALAEGCEFWLDDGCGVSCSWSCGGSGLRY